MKVIDLLSKIANGEEVPKKIKWNGDIYKYDEYNNAYEDENDITLFRSMGFYKMYVLNDEVEIIEEEKKIPEKLTTWFSLEKDCKNDNIQYANYNFETMYEKINEICDYLKSKGE